MFRELFLGMLFLCLGAGSGYIHLTSYLESRVLNERGVVIEAVTTGSSFKLRSSSSSYYIKIQYNVDNVVYNSKRKVPESVFNKYANKYAFLPSQIPIVYSPEDPSVFEIKDSAIPIKFEGWWLSIAMMLVFVLLGFLFIYGFYLNRKSQKSN